MSSDSEDLARNQRTQAASRGSSSSLKSALTRILTWWTSFFTITDKPLVVTAEMDEDSSKRPALTLDGLQQALSDRYGSEVVATVVCDAL